MTQQQFNIIGFEPVGDKSIPIFSKFPDEYEGSWAHITPVNNGKVKYVSTFYFNDQHPSGTVIVSDFILNSYPDMYHTFYLDGSGEKVYVSPKFRQKGLVLISALLLIRIFYSYLNGFLVKGSEDRSPAIDKVYLKLQKILNEPIKEYVPESAVSVYGTEPARDAIYPHIWYNQRIGGTNE